MHSPRSSRRASGVLTPSFQSHVLEHLETRRLLSKTVSAVSMASNTLNVIPTKPIELRPDLIDPKTGLSAPSRVADPAMITWTNRANTTTSGATDTDKFGAIFGTFAPQARAVVDAVISDYQRMIVSFDYPTAGQTFSLNLSMGSAGGGFGASAGLSTYLGGKPKAGSITMGAGSGTG